MSHLIFAVIAIFVLAALISVGSNYLNPSAIEEEIEKTRILSALNTYVSELNNYALMFGDYPDDSAKIYGTNRQARIEPIAIDGFSWTYSKNNGSPYLCLSGDAYKSTYNAIVLANLENDSATAINTSCGSTSDISTPSSYPVTLAVTFYVGD